MGVLTKLVKFVIAVLVILMITTETGKWYLFNGDNGTVMRTYYQIRTNHMTIVERFNYDLSWLWYYVTTLELPKSVPHIFPR